MNERIKELADQCYDIYSEHNIDLERFAELIRQDERLKCSEDYLSDCAEAVEAARLEEREACAKLVDEWGLTVCAAAIRGRTE